MSALFSLVPDVRPVLAHREGDRQVFGARPRRHQLQVRTDLSSVTVHLNSNIFLILDMSFMRLLNVVLS